MQRYRQGPGKCSSPGSSGCAFKTLSSINRIQPAVSPPAVEERWGSGIANCLLTIIMASSFTVCRRLSLSFCPFDHLWLLVEGRGVISHGDELTLGIFCTFTAIIVHGGRSDRSKTVGFYHYQAMLQVPVVSFRVTITSRMWIQ